MSRDQKSSLVHHEFKIFSLFYYYFSHWKEPFDHYKRAAIQPCAFREIIVQKICLEENINYKCIHGLKLLGLGVRKKIFKPSTITKS